MNTVETLESPFKHLVMTIGELPTTFVESMSYYEAIAWLVDYIRNNVIPSINNNAEAIKEIQEWIQTLDLQDEVDNKLEEMAESGELTEIIAQYLQLGAVIAFNTLSDMIGSDNLADGSTCRILGKTDYKDGDGSYYKIRELINTDVVDGDNLVALTNYPTLVAEKVPHGFIGDLDDLDTENKDNIVDAINEVENRRFIGLQYTPFVVFVDSVNGDDDNDGLTHDTRMKTINKAIETYANKEMRGEFRIALSTGSYDFTIFNLTDVSLHFGHDTSDNTTGTITINMINPVTVNPDDIAFYSGHFNFGGSANHPFVINYDNANGMYFDNCQFVANYTTFNGLIRVYSGCTDFTNCVVKSIASWGANLIFANSQVGFINLDASKLQARSCIYLTYINPSEIESRTGDYLINARNSELYIYGPSYVSYQGTPSKTNLCNIEGSRLSIGAVLNAYDEDIIVPFTGSCTILDSVIIATATRWNGFKQHATTLNVSSACIASDGLTLS